LSLSGVAHAAEPLKVTYGIYTGGFHVVDMHGTYTLQDDKYDLQMDMETVGLLGRLAPWAGVIHTNGLNKGAASTPLVHSFASTWRGDVETTTFSFDKNGRLQSYLLEEGDGTIKNEMPDKEVYQDNPVDMLSALFRTMHGKTCESTQPALDGKRRFDMVFTSKGTETRQANRYSIYEGPTEICEVEIVPVAGKWREKPRGWMSLQGQAKEKGQLPRLWFGKVRDDMPPIPVRFFIKTDYGTMVMHLQDITS
jgi:hypothetical protein